MSERKVKNYLEHEVVAQLRKKPDLNIIGKQIQENSGDSCKGSVGIKSRGKIDFLVKYCGYNHFYVEDFKRH